MRLQTGKNILICPLEWGLGHAGRMVPVAKKLSSLGHNVIIGSGEEHIEFFRKELPGLKYISFPGFRIRYSSWLPQYVVILLRGPAFFFSIFREHRLLKKLIRLHQIEIVISDSRPGLWNRSIKTVFVTHMLRVPLPPWAKFMESSRVFFIDPLIRKFSYCFIPDLENENNLSGKLSHITALPANARYIGILSRFDRPAENRSAEEYRYFCLVILSGPEPQRGILKKKMTGLLRSHSGESVILEGRPGNSVQKVVDGNITFISHLPTSELTELIMTSRFIVSRSGYSTLMELAGLGRTALIIPTPGQTEQEYLAEYLSQKGWFTTTAQDKISQNTLFDFEESHLPHNLMDESDKLLNAALSELLQ